jgi:hypothetical protein
VRFLQGADGEREGCVVGWEDSERVVGVCSPAG